MRLLTGRRVEVASYLVVALATSFVVVLALDSDGNARHQVDLNDGGVWVTSTPDRSFGRVNKPIDELDGVARIPTSATDPSLDIVQEGPAVVGVDEATSELHAVDPTSAAIPDGGTTTIAPQSDVALHGETLAVVDRAQGRIWATRVEPDLGLVSVSDVDGTAKPLETVGPDAGGTVLGDGRVAAASVSAGELLVLDPDQGWSVTERRELDLAGTPRLTAVGDVPVVLDSESGELHLREGVTATVAPDAVLQQPGPAASVVLVTTPSELLAVDLGTGDTTVLAEGQAGSPAAAVRIGDCAYTAWSGSSSAPGAVVTSCEGSDPVVASVRGTALVLRANRGQVMLNDRVSGAVWNIDQDQPQRIDNWQDFAPVKTKDQDGDEKKEQDPRADEQPPRAKPDELGARPGTTTVLHVLDNDQAPNGRLLSISRVGETSDPDVAARISPDGQTVLLDVPDGAEGQVTFDYWVNAGNGKDVDARVTVPLRGPDSQQPPRLRDGINLVPPPDYVVPARGSLNLSVIGDWRDPAEGDAVSVTDAEVKEQGGGRAFVTAGGQIRFEAPATGGQQVVSYTVTDSGGASSQEAVTVTVQGPKVIEATPPVAQPDLGRGTVGSPIVVRPLANDIPGSDPLDRNATLVLAAPVVAPSGLQISTDQATGELTIIGSRPGTYQLSYQAGFGDAAPSTAAIRVDVVDLPAGAVQPVTVPDSISLFGTSQGIVDVLANDYDPQGRVLVTQRAEVLRASDSSPAEPIEVSVIDGKWVRLRATGPVTQNPVTVRYTITNGLRGGVTGDIAVRVTSSPNAKKDQPVTTDDQATVRAGSAVVVPVLDNDFTPSGAPVQLVAGGTGDAEGVDGRLTVTPAVGEATVSGRFLRYTAPADITVAQTVDVAYYATNATGATELGVAHIRITPPPSDSLANQPPTPPTVEARVVSGDTVRIKIPAGTADPDGDAVTVTGVSSATSLGRVLRYGATELQYEAFPSTAGTDTFTYEVTDPYGATAEGRIRVAVVPPEQAQPPIAVDDTLYAAPGRQVTLRVLANDYIAAGDAVEILPLEEANAELPDDVELASPTGPVVLTAGERVVELRYRISNGIDSSVGSITVRSVKGYNNPPVVYDAYGTLADAGEAADTVTVDVLEKAYDPDGDAGALRLVSVGSDPQAAEEAGIVVRRDGRVTVPLADHPQVLPYLAEDSDGAVASAFLYVPARPGDALRLTSAEPLELEAGGTLELDVADLVTDPTGGDVRLTTTQTDQSAAPAEVLSLTGRGRTTLVLTAEKDDYVGPGSITFEVTNAATLGEEGAQTAVFTLPVQVGSAQPVFRCPETPLTLEIGGTPITPDIAQLCYVWTPDPAAPLDIEASAVSSSLDGLDITADGGSEITLAAPDTMSPTANPGELEVRDAATGASGILRIRVTDAGPPTLTPVTIEGVDAGESRRIDLAGNFTSPLADAVPRVVTIQQQGADTASESIEGSAVTITPDEGSSGRMTWEVVMTDVDDPNRPGRTATSTITLDVRDVPSRPAAPDAVADDATVTLSWAAPDDNGAPITGYTVRYGGTSRACGAAPRCTITGLTNGEPYQFTVTATNAVGTSEESPPSKAVTPDAIPGAVVGLTSGVPRDHKVPISWSKPEKQTSIDTYVITWPGHQGRTSKTNFVVGTDSNNQPYTVKVYALNKKGVGEARTISVQSSGKPDAPTDVTVTSVDGAGEQAAVTVTWAHSNWEGPPGHYEVTRSDGVKHRVDAGVHEIRESIPYNGQNYTWSVVAVNGTTTNVPTHTSAPGKSAPYQAADVPETPTWQTSEETGNDKQGHFVFTAGEVRGTGSRYELKTDEQTTQGAVGSGGRVDVNVPAGENGDTVTPSIRICNDQKGCSAWVNGPPLEPYGPLRSSAISNFSTSASGQTTSFSATIDTNGRPATVRVTGNRGYSQTWTIDSRSQRISGSDNVGYSTNQTFTITVSASGRGSVTRSDTSPTTDSPPRTVTVIKGARHNDVDCTHSSCAFFGARTSGFPGSVRCSARTQTGSVSGWSPWTQGGNDSHISTNYYGYPGRWIVVTCDGVDSPRFYW